LVRGCHALIRGGATLVENASDILRELHIYHENQCVNNSVVPSTPVGSGGGELDNDYKILLDAFGHEPASVDQLVERSGLPSPSVASMLLVLELEGRVELQTDGHYMRP